MKVPKGFHQWPEEKRALWLEGARWGRQQQAEKQLELIRLMIGNPTKWRGAELREDGTPVMDTLLEHIFWFAGKIQGEEVIDIRLRDGYVIIGFPGHYDYKFDGEGSLRKVGALS